jgi:hypothetical protein
MLKWAVAGVREEFVKAKIKMVSAHTLIEDRFMFVRLRPSRHPTIELTRRREFIQASPDESSCETRSRRSRPTICYTAISAMGSHEAK